LNVKCLLKCFSKATSGLPMETIYLALSLTLGTLVAQRFKVLILVPTTILVAIVPLLGGFMDVATHEMRIVVAGLAVIGLQGGYLLGLGARSLYSLGQLGHTPESHRPSAARWVERHTRP
jgi:hypothetical protein